MKVPEGIVENIAATLRWRPPSWMKKPCLDKFVYIIQKITSLSFNNRKYKRLRMVPISSIVLRYELGKHYRRYLDWLIDNKFIVSDNHYVVGSHEKEGKCKCYGISKRFKSKSLVDYELKNAFILKKILNWRKNKLSETVSDPLMARLYSMMSSFSIDIDSARQELEELKENGAITTKQMAIELDKCEKINKKDESVLDLFIVKDEYSRVHTNLTNISKIIRENHLYVGGKKAVGIDIVSSQPALLHSLFQDYVNRIENLPKSVISSPFYLEFDDNRTDLRQKYVNKSNNYDGNPILNPNSEISLSKLGFTSFEECLNSLKKEIKKYSHSLDCGIYEFFMDEWGKFWGEDLKRSVVKQRWLTYVFGQAKSPVMKNMEIIWQYHFPVLDKLLKYMKKGDHKILAHTLQKKEADIIYNKLCPKIQERYDLEFSTVHDSILINEDIADEIRELFEEVLDENHIMTVVS